MGRTRKTLEQSKGNLTVLEQEKKRKVEEALSDITKLSPEPPMWLDNTAKEEYKRVYPLLQELPHSGALDLALLSAYCQAYSDYINATIRMNKDEPIIETERGTKLNQNHAIKRDALNQLNSIAPKIGMSTDSRMKIFTPKEEKKSDAMGDMLNARRKN